MLCELDDQNRVLAGETHEHDQTNLRKDVVIAALQPHSAQREEQAERHDQNDGQRGQKSMPSGTCVIGPPIGKTTAQAKHPVDEAHADGEPTEKTKPLP